MLLQKELMSFRNFLCGMTSYRPLVSQCKMLCTSALQHNSCRTSVTRINRKVYARVYPTMFVYPDGSTITIRHHEPRAILKLPLDLSTLSETEKAARLAKRKPKKKVAVQEDYDDSFDVNKYSHLWKQK